MAHYIRVLLTEWENMPLGDLVSHGRKYGHELRPDAPLDDPEWREADVYGHESTSPIELEVALDDGTPDCLLRVELDEFREELEDSDGRVGRARLLRPAGRGACSSQAEGEGFYEGEELILAVS